MSDPSLDHFERKVAEDREALARSLETLSETVKPDHLKDELSQAVELYGRKIWDLTRDNPAAFALVGAGATLLLTGVGHREKPVRRQPTTSVPPLKSMDGFDDRVAAADEKMHRGQRANSARKPSASRMRAALNKGIEKLPPAARDRVIKARLSAIRAQEAVEDRARRLARKSSGAARKYPIETAALAFGAGVIGATLLPSTEKEDDLFGNRRDQLMDSARQAFAAEIDALKRSAKAPDHSRNQAASSVAS